MKALRYLLGAALFAGAFASPINAAAEQRDVAVGSELPAAAVVPQALDGGLEQRSASLVEEDHVPRAEDAMAHPPFSSRLRAAIAQLNADLDTFEGMLRNANEIGQLYASFPASSQRLIAVMFMQLRQYYESVIPAQVERISRKASQRPWLKPLVRPVIQRAYLDWINLDISRWFGTQLRWPNTQELQDLGIDARTGPGKREEALASIAEREETFAALLDRETDDKPVNKKDFDKVSNYMKGVIGAAKKIGGSMKGLADVCDDAPKDKPPN